jgi:hypothetical protein
MAEILAMAKRGRVWIPGGSARSNPIHGADLAEVCLGELAFEALGTPPRISVIPPWTLAAAGEALRPFNTNLASLILMIAALETVDSRCDACGTHRVSDFFGEIAARRSQRTARGTARE